MWTYLYMYTIIHITKQSLDHDVSLCILVVIEIDTNNTFYLA